MSENQGIGRNWQSQSGGLTHGRTQPHLDPTSPLLCPTTGVELVQLPHQSQPPSHHWMHWYDSYLLGAMGNHGSIGKGLWPLSNLHSHCTYPPFILSEVGVPLQLVSLTSHREEVTVVIVASCLLRGRQKQSMLAIWFQPL